jgi:hypothetical protein
MSFDCDVFSRESWSETEFCFGQSFCCCESCELSLFPVKCREYLKNCRSNFGK